MPFAELQNGPPSCPSVGCRDGYFWSGSRTVRKVQFPCVYVEVRSLTVLQVAQTYEGDAQSRAVALLKLTEGQRGILYPAHCTGCTQNHEKNARNLVRAYRAIHERVREHCAGMPIGDYLKLAAVRGDTPEDTLLAQLKHAAASAFRRAS